MTFTPSDDSSGPRPEIPGSFTAACFAVVDYVRTALPMGMWAVTRVVDDRQVLLVVDPPEYPFETGSEWDLATSLCARMGRHGGPLVIADVAAHPQFRDYVTPGGFIVGAYGGTVITDADGRVFGTLCGWSPRPQPALADAAAPVLQVFGTLLSSLLQMDLALTTAQRNTERAQLLSDTDEMTGLLNRRGWNRFLDLEQERQRRFGDPAGVVIVDVDDLKGINDTVGHHAGDELLRRTAAVLVAQTRAVDVVARLGGDEFGVIAVGATPSQTSMFRARLQQALAGAGVAASVGASPVAVKNGFHHAIREADDRMYADKRTRRAAPTNAES